MVALRKRLALAVLFTSSSIGVSAQKVGLKEDVGFSCFNCALNWDFHCPKEVLPFNCRCESENFLTTALGCVAKHATDIDQVVKGWNYIRDQCHYWGGRTMSIEQLQEIYEANKSDLINADNATSSNPPGPVSVSKTLFEKQQVAAWDTKYHYNVGNYFAWAVLGYWGFVLLGGILTNGIRILCPNIYNVFGSGKITCVRKYLTLPALAGNKHHSPYRIFRYITLNLPTRGQFFILMGFTALNVASIASFNDVKGESPLAFLSQSDRKLHYLANRTGIIAIGHIPILVLFACRNNPFIYLTGWPYDTFMMYHRWCARFMGLHAIIHGIAIYWSSMMEKVVIFKWENIHNWRGGNLAVYMVIIMLTMGLRMIRSRIYETFKATHIFMFLVFIISMLVHLSDYGWLGWLWTAVVFYVIEYSCRLSAVLVSGGIQEARFTLTDAGMYRVKVPGGRRKWDVKPGAYVYIRILDKNLFWQAHPFSVFQGYNSVKDDSLDLCCKAQLGATRVMLQNLIATPQKTFARKVIIEGPYGNENYVSSYDSILLFAGGVGFTAMYNFASHIIKRLKPGQRLSLIWVVKDCKHLHAFENELSFLARCSNEMCQIRIFVTKPEEMDLGTVALTDLQNDFKEKEFSTEETQQSTNSSKVTLVGTSKKPDPNHSELSDRHRCSGEAEDACRVLVDGDVILNIEYGRPDIHTDVSDFIRSAGGTKAICSCGPPMFVDAIRDGIVGSIVDSDHRVDYFEDAFSW